MSRGYLDGRVLRFSVARIPVIVQPSFFVVAALIGLQLGTYQAVVAWVGIVFFSILIHELGHALTARRYGSEVAISLNVIGGLTSWTMPEGGLTPGRRAAVAAAGSGVGLIFGLLVWLVTQVSGPVSGLTAFVVSNLIWVNVGWGLLNWLPIRPLDGGHLFTSLMEKVSPRHGPRIADFVFLGTAAAGLALALYLGLIFAALITGWLLWSEVTRRMPTRPRVPIPEMSFDYDDEEES